MQVGITPNSIKTITKAIHLIYFLSCLLHALIVLIIKKAHQNEKIDYCTTVYQQYGCKR